MNGYHDQLARKGLLIVDDEAAIRELMSIVLEQAGYPSFQARNGLEALEIFRRCHAEIGGVITDMHMPELDGFGLVRGIRIIAPDMKIILSSGSLGEAERQIAADLGVNAFIAKPWTASQLASCAQSVFESTNDSVGLECGAGAA